MLKICFHSFNEVSRKYYLQNRYINEWLTCEFPVTDVIIKCSKCNKSFSLLLEGRVETGYKSTRKVNIENTRG
jgi:hypothetical protein